VTGTTKYGHQGNCNNGFLCQLDIPEDIRKKLSKWGNMGLANGTWSTYRTAERLWWMCMKENKRRGELPATESDTAIFVSWLLHVRKVKAGTVNGYLAGIRQMHVVKGMQAPEIRTASINLILKGKKNAENIEKRRGEGIKRLPVTMDLMRIIRQRLRTWNKDSQTKLLVWAVSTLAFHGAFRAGEILAKEERIFDKDFTLLTEDIKLMKDLTDDQYILEVKLKSPKEDKAGKAVVVEVFQTKGELCLVKAFLCWRKRAKTEIGMPLFRQGSGVSLTSHQLNTWLRDLLGNDVM
jgi:hypothetical protein